jgi:HlyD family secretion protein
MRTKIGLLIALLVMATAAGLGYRYAARLAAHNGARIRVSGNIEVTDVAVAFRIPGRVEKRPIDEGELAQKGQLVAQLDTSDLQQEVAVRLAGLKAAEAAWAELKAGSRPEEIAAAKAAFEKAAAALADMEAGSRDEEIKAAEARVTKATAEKIRTEDQLRRYTQLFERRVLAPEDYESAQAAYRSAAAALQEATQQLNLARKPYRQEQLDQARAAKAQAQAQYDLVKAGPRQEEKDQARARVEEAQAALQRAKTQLGYATLVSPLSGVVLSKNVEPGEYVVPGTPVVTVGDLGSVWLRAYIDETDLGRVKMGQPVRVTTDTYPDKQYRGRVSFIASEAEFTPKNVQTEKERVKLVYRIKIDVANPNMELKPGMPADAEILLEKAEGSRPE